MTRLSAAVSIAWALTVGWCVYWGAKPVLEFAYSMQQDCVLPGTVKEKK
jgi:hypothetical protein